MRSCGDCTACCTGIFELEVDGQMVGPGNPCPHLREYGCSIHLHRPVVCREFNCAWRMGKKFVVPLPFLARPDLCGAAFHPATDVFKGDEAICGAQCGDIVDHTLEKWIDECLEAEYVPLIIPSGSTLRVVADKVTGKIRHGVSFLKEALSR